MSKDTEWSARDEQIYRDGESNAHADWAIAFDEVLPSELDQWSPTGVAKYVELLQAKVERVEALCDAEDARIAEANRRFIEEGRIALKTGKPIQLVGILTTRGIRAALADA